MSADPPDEDPIDRLSRLFDERRRIAPSHARPPEVGGEAATDRAGEGSTGTARRHSPGPSPPDVGQADASEDLQLASRLQEIDRRLAVISQREAQIRALEAYLARRLQQANQVDTPPVSQATAARLDAELKALGSRLARVEQLLSELDLRGEASRGRASNPSRTPQRR